MQRPARCHFVLAAIIAICSLGSPTAKAAEKVTACTSIKVCYCVNPEVRDAIDKNVAHLREVITQQKASGKAIGYLSVPLSTTGGGYFNVNLDIAKATKAEIEKRYGGNSVWILNPGTEASLPPGASGADYMLMWTQILEGPKGLGEDFDFFYFVGPTSVGHFFALTGEGDMERIDNYFEKRLADDPGLKKAVDAGRLSKATFRNYYALRASVSFSYGSHDEWNIARLLNEQRRAAKDFGIANQIAVFFDGRAATPNDFEGATAGGNVGPCK